MSTWTLIQVVFDIFASLGIFIIVMRLSRAPKDDPRLSRGLQLLQSKISVLEDLSDRTEAQVNQLTALLEQKSREVQAKVQLAERHVHEIKVSMANSLEVAKIFQDRIPHQEIIERQNSIKYVQAARLAHQGLSVEEIANQVSLPKGEIEFIAKVNREQLMFNEEQLPAWAKNPSESDLKSDTESHAHGAMFDGQAGVPAVGVNFGQYSGGVMNANSIAGLAVADGSSGLDAASGACVTGADGSIDSSTSLTAAESADRKRAEQEIAERQKLVENLSRLQAEMQQLDQQLARENAGRNLSAAFDAPRVDTESLQRLGDEFRRACEEAKEKKPSLLPSLEQLSSMIPQFFQVDEESEQQSDNRVEAGAMGVSREIAIPSAGAGALAPNRQPTTSAAGLGAVLAANAEVSKARAATVAAAVGAPGATGASLSHKQEAQSTELVAARAMARELSQPVIRKVVFPRIDAPQGRS